MTKLRPPAQVNYGRRSPAGSDATALPGASAIKWPDSTQACFTPVGCIRPCFCVNAWDPSHQQPHWSRPVLHACCTNETCVSVSPAIHVIRCVHTSAGEGVLCWGRPYCAHTYTSTFNGGGTQCETGHNEVWSVSKPRTKNSRNLCVNFCQCLVVTDHLINTTTHHLCCL